MTTGAETREPPKTRTEASVRKDPLPALQRTTEAEPSETNFLQQGMTDPALVGLIVLIIWAPFVYFCLHSSQGTRVCPAFLLARRATRRAARISRG